MLKLSQRSIDSDWKFEVDDEDIYLKLMMKSFTSMILDK